MVALNYGEIKWNPERVSNIKPFKHGTIIRTGITCKKIPL